MSLKQYIDRRARRAAEIAYKDSSYIRQNQTASNAGQLAKIASIENGRFIAYLADGSFIEIAPGPTSRGLSEGSIIYLINGVQIF